MASSPEEKSSVNASLLQTALGRLKKAHIAHDASSPLAHLGSEEQAEDQRNTYQRRVLDANLESYYDLLGPELTFETAFVPLTVNDADFFVRFYEAREAARAQRMQQGLDEQAVDDEHRVGEWCRQSHAHLLEQKRALVERLRPAMEAMLKSHGRGVGGEGGGAAGCAGGVVADSPGCFIKLSSRSPKDAAVLDRAHVAALFRKELAQLLGEEDQRSERSRASSTTVCNGTTTVPASASTSSPDAVTLEGAAAEEGVERGAAIPLPPPPPPPAARSPFHLPPSADPCKSTSTTSSSSAAAAPSHATSSASSISTTNARVIAMLRAGTRLLCHSTPESAVHMLCISERIYQDCLLALDQPDRFAMNICVRAWKNIDPRDEFRCFCPGPTGAMAAMSQYNVLAYWPELSIDKDKLRSTLVSFYNTTILPRLTTAGLHTQGFVCDLAIEQGTQRVWCLELNPFLDSTDGALFSWAHEREILEGKTDAASQPVFRVLDRPPVGAKALIAPSWRWLLDLDVE